MIFIRLYSLTTVCYLVININVKFNNNDIDFKKLIIVVESEIYSFAIYFKTLSSKWEISNRLCTRKRGIHQIT